MGGVSDLVASKPVRGRRWSAPLNSVYWSEKPAGLNQEPGFLVGFTDRIAGCSVCPQGLDQQAVLRFPTPPHADVTEFALIALLADTLQFRFDFASSGVDSDRSLRVGHVHRSTVFALRACTESGLCILAIVSSRSLGQIFLAGIWTVLHRRVLAIPSKQWLD